jgi:hypothetical protein
MASAQRTVNNNLIESTGFPVLRIQIDPTLQYVGGPDFILYNVARAEQHLFIDAGADRQVRRLVWVQFEGYLPDNTHTYDYSSSQKMEISGWPFYVDSGWNDIRNQTEERPGSDGAAVRNHLAQLGFTYPELELVERYVTVSSDHRSELMIIYAEDGGWRGLRAEALSEGGETGEPWLAVQKELHQRGIESFRILPA